MIKLLGIILICSPVALAGSDIMETILYPLLQMQDDWFGRGSAFWGYGLWLFNLLVNFLTLLVLHLLLRKTLIKMVTHTYESRFKILATGLGYLFGIPVIAAFCLVSILGIPSGVLLLMVFVLSLWCGNCLAALLVTHYLNSRNVDSWNFWTIILLSLAMVTIMDLILLFPLLGAIGYALVLVVAYGITVLYVWDNREKILELTE